MISQQQLKQALQAIDKANQADPNTVLINGQTIAKELIYGQRMSQSLKQFMPDAGCELQIAARAQHIQRWQQPRSDFPTGKIGYYQWRIQLGKYHAQQTAGILRQLGVAPEAISTVESLLKKQNLKSDPQMQTLEDVICLVFLEFYFESFAQKHQEDKIISILQKTWAKMSPQGQRTALKLPLPKHLLTLVKKALG